MLDGTRMSRKLLIDCDPGIDDAVALTLALFTQDIELVAITATAGNVSAAQASRNVQAIVEQLDPVRYPRMGTARIDLPRDHHARNVHGSDGLGNSDFVVSELHHQHASEKIIGDVMREDREDLTILALGPLSNVASAITTDPELASQVGRLVMMGGSLREGGNITPAAEFNMYCDPAAASTVFRSRTTKILVPLDITHRITEGLDLLDQLPPESSRAGCFLRRILPFLFRSVRQQFGLEGVHLHDVIALMIALHPELSKTEEMAGDVETDGNLTRGCTVFDLRARPKWRSNMEVVVEIDVPAVRDRMLEALHTAGQRSS